MKFSTALLMKQSQKKLDQEKLYSYGDIVDDDDLARNLDAAYGGLALDLKFKLETLPLEYFKDYKVTKKDVYNLGGDPKHQWGMIQFYIKHPEQAEPIVVENLPGAGWHIYDGQHRTAAAFFRGDTTIQAYVVVEE